MCYITETLHVSKGLNVCQVSQVTLCLSGVFTLTAVSWYAARVINEFYDPLYGGVRSVTHKHYICSRSLMITMMMVTMRLCVDAAGSSWVLVCIWGGRPPVWLYWEDLCSAVPTGRRPTAPLHGKATAAPQTIF